MCRENGFDEFTMAQIDREIERAREIENQPNFQPKHKKNKQINAFPICSQVQVKQFQSVKTS